jgi:hypothetical protein
VDPELSSPVPFLSDRHLNTPYRGPILKRGHTAESAGHDIMKQRRSASPCF